MAMRYSVTPASQVTMYQPPLTQERPSKHQQQSEPARWAGWVLMATKRATLRSGKVRALGACSEVISEPIQGQIQRAS